MIGSASIDFPIFLIFFTILIKLISKSLLATTLIASSFQAWLLPAPSCSTYCYIHMAEGYSGAVRVSWLMSSYYFLAPSIPMISMGILFLFVLSILSSSSLPRPLLFSLHHFFWLQYCLGYLVFWHLGLAFALAARSQMILSLLSVKSWLPYVNQKNRLVLEEADI